MISATQNQSFYGGYGRTITPATPQPTKVQEGIDALEKRQTYGTSLLEYLDDKAYVAFERATMQLGDADKRLAAQVLEKAASRSAAMQYAMEHEIDNATKQGMVYNYFDAYDDVVSAEQIKNLLNARLQDGPAIEGEKFESEQFLTDYLAQLGGPRKLDIRV